MKECNMGVREKKINITMWVGRGQGSFFSKETDGCANEGYRKSAH
jgi:hypothetical protein